MHREVPYGENEKRSKKALYHLSDPFLRLWFKGVAPHRGSLRTATKAARLKLLDSTWSNLRAEAWEDLCRLAVPRLGLFDREWHAAGRYWKGNQSEWDVASTSLDQSVLMLGECKSLARPAEQADIEKIVRDVIAKTAPANLGSGNQQREYVIFVPERGATVASLPANITIIDAHRVFTTLKA